jgi:Ca2+-binding EF-hand superfamily protein
MLDRLHALQDEKSAADKLAAAIDAANQGTAEFSSFIGGVNTGIRQYLDKLNATAGGTASPEAQLAVSKAQFQRQIALASAGDRTALSGITSYADQLLQAQIGYSASGGDTGQVIESIKAALANLPTMETSEEYMARVFRETSAAQIKAMQDATGSFAASVGGMANLLAGKFDLIDMNLDGLLTFDELKAALGPLATDPAIQDLIRRVDTNGDGQVSKLELIRASLYDTASWQISSAAQFSANEQSTIWNGLWGSAGLLASKFDMVDTNISGLLDFNELKAALGPLATDDTIRALIGRADANGDGQLSRLEIINASVWGTSAQQIAVQQQTQQIIAAASASSAAAVAANTAAVSALTGYIFGDGGGDGSDGGAGDAGGGGAVGGDGSGNASSGVGSADGSASYAIGTNYVPRDMKASIHQGEAIIPKAFNPWAGGTGLGGSDPALVAELRGLRADNAKLRADLLRLIEVSAAGARGTINSVDQVAANTANSARAVALRSSQAPVA